MKAPTDKSEKSEKSENSEPANASSRRRRAALIRERLGNTDPRRVKPTDTDPNRVKPL